MVLIGNSNTNWREWPCAVLVGNWNTKVRIYHAHIKMIEHDILLTWGCRFNTHQLCILCHCVVRQNNGLTERIDKTIKQVITAYVDPLHQSWDQVLPFALHAYNTSIQESTRVSPLWAYMVGIHYFHLTHRPSRYTLITRMQHHGGYTCNPTFLSSDGHSNTTLIRHNNVRINISTPHISQVNWTTVYSLARAQKIMWIRLKIEPS